MNYCNNNGVLLVVDRCKYTYQYENMIHVCKKCDNQGKELEVSKRYEEENSWYNYAKNVWSRYVIECLRCGVIYRSRQYWYGNNTEDVAVRKKITHVWSVVNISKRQL